MNHQHHLTRALVGSQYLTNVHFSLPITHFDQDAAIIPEFGGSSGEFLMLNPEMYSGTGTNFAEGIPRAHVRFEDLLIRARYLQENPSHRDPQASRN